MIMNSHLVETNGIHLNVIQAGPENGPLVILLHGFPEFSYAWREQIPFLVSAGYRVWAPDQRGYNLSDKPSGIAAYSIDELAADVVGLIDAANQKQAIVIGHDWGAGVAWWLAMKYPDRLSKMVVMNVPHGAVMQKHMRSNFSQIRKSWYIFFFQLPWLPEFLARRNNWRWLSNAIKKSSRQDTFNDVDMDRYRESWSQPNAISAMLNWYRAFVQKPPAVPANLRISVPTLLIWGVKDTALGKEMAQPSIDLCDNGRLVYIEEATHWVQHDEPEKVNELIGEFLKE